VKRTIDLGLPFAAFIAEQERVTMTCTFGARIVRAVEGLGE